jgi:hypothetical protein
MTTATIITIVTEKKTGYGNRGRKATAGQYTI